MADVDHFKGINDTHGHPVGDDVLREVAKRFLGAIRPRDAVGRFGGEEFLFVMPGVTDEDTAVRIAERIRESVSNRTMAEGLQVTTSVGMVAPVDGAAVDAETLIAAADVELYRAKAEGRNCVRWSRLGASASTSAA